MKVAHSHSRIQNYKLQHVAIHRQRNMNIDDLLDYGIREGNEGSENSPKEASHQAHQSFPVSANSFSSFLNPHAQEYGVSSASSQNSIRNSHSQNFNPIGKPSSLDSNRSYGDMYMVQEPEDRQQFHYPRSHEDIFYPSDYSTFPGTPSTFGASQSMSRSHDYFEDHQIYQQRPKKFTDTSYLYPPAQYGGPLRTRSMGNIPTKASSFRANPPMHLGSYGETGYSNQIAASYDQPLSTFGEDLHGFSPLRTPSKGSVLSQGNWPNAAATAPTLGPYPAPTLGPVPTPPSSAAAPKTKDQKKSPAPIDGYVYQVQFKRAHRNFVLAPSAPRDIIPGDFVKVEADRGEDMGIVLAKIPADSFEEVIPTAGYRGRGFSSGQGERKFLYRRATPEERNSLQEKVADEEKALETVREKSKEKNLPMKVLDAEYQFDRHKLIFYFEADKRIDFRDLVSELFSQYKTRIWMQQVDTSSLPIHDPGTDLARATGFLPARDDDFAGYGRTPSFGSAATTNTLDTFSDSSKGPSSSSVTGGQSLPSPSANSGPSIFPDPWGNYRF